jgi:undecaprenyl-diphosphatase
MMRVSRRELLLLSLGLLVLLALWMFVALADEVLEGETHALDKAILLAMRRPGAPSDPWGSDQVEELGRDLTALGGVGVLTLLTAIVAGFLVLQGKRRMALMIIVAISCGALLSTGLKRGFDRPRPDLVPHRVRVYSASFPSGHAMLSAVVYLTLGTLLARVQPSWRLRLYVLIVAFGLTFLIGVSRVYLGVHWPTDVLAGWTAGAAWAFACWLLTLWMQQRGWLE